MGVVHVDIRKAMDFIACKLKVVGGDETYQPFDVSAQQIRQKLLSPASVANADVSLLQNRGFFNSGLRKDANCLGVRRLAVIIHWQLWRAVNFIRPQ